MMKKKLGLSSFAISQEDVNMQKTHSAVVEADIDSPINKPSKEKKDLSIFADISHKNTSGANNWQAFLKLNQTKTNSLCKSRPNIKKTNRPFYPNELSSENPDAVGLAVPKEKCLKIKKINFNNSTRTGPNRNDVPVLNCNEVQSMPKGKYVEKQNKTNKPGLTKQIAMDCEMVGVEVGVNNSILARVSLVNAHGDCIYDKYVKPTEPILDYRTRFSGIRPKDLENASDFKIVQQEVADIITGRILVGHSLNNDLGVLFLSHPRNAIRDTSKFKRFRVGPIPALKNLAKKFLGVTIQDGEHCSVQDALAAMQLYKMFKKEWEASFYKKKVTKQKEKTKSASSALTTTMDIQVSRAFTPGGS